MSCNNADGDHTIASIPRGTLASNEVQDTGNDPIEETGSDVIEVDAVDSEALQSLPRCQFLHRRFGGYHKELSVKGIVISLSAGTLRL